MNIVAPEYNSVNPNYYAMSKGDLVAIIESQKAVIQRFYRLLPVPNKVLAPGEKLAWAVAKPLIEKEKPNEKGLVRIPIDEIAEKIGMSDSSASRYIQNICERFDATHQVEPYVTKKGQQRNLTYINPTDPIWATYPDELTLPAEKERTINGNQCPHCHSNNTLRVKKRTIATQDVTECQVCGYTKVYPVEQVNEPLPPMEYRPEKKGPQPEEPFAAEKVENLHCLRVHTVVPPPEVLRSLPLWCCHRAKVPYNAKPARSPQKAKSDDPSTWATYEQTLATFEASHSWRYPYDGIGVMNNGDYTFIDLDHCIDEQGQISDQAQACIDAFNSYTERSRSGTGIHIIARGTLPKDVKRPGVEMYNHHRFFVWTGQHLAGTPETIEERQTAIDTLYKELVPDVPKLEIVSNLPPQPQFNPSGSDDAILAKLQGDTKAWNLWTADQVFIARLYPKEDGSPDYSRADLALCKKLSYWGAGGNVSTIDRLFRKSGLMRPKWDRSVGKGETYGERTINCALGKQERRGVS